MSTVIATTNNPNMNYTYHHVLGDGSCFINCYLEACSSSYKNANTTVKMRIARKFRLDFANFLLTKSSKTPQQISARLNILNPTIMSTLIKSTKPNESSTDVLMEISSKYNENEEDSENFIYGLIMGYNFIDVGTKQVLTFVEIKELYETDHRINVSRAEVITTHGTTPYDPSVYGYGKIPIDIGYYELVTNVGSGYDDIEQCVKTLCHRSEFLTHLESSLIARFISINAIIFPLGTFYKNYYRMIEHVEGAPELLMVNLKNIHWNLVAFTFNDREQLLLNTVPEKSKNSIFSNLSTMFDQRRL